MELSLGVVAISVLTNYETSSVLAKAWHRWHSHPYPRLQASSPVKWSCQSCFIDRPSGESSNDTSATLDKLGSSRRCELHPGWEVNPLLRERRIEKIVHHALDDGRNVIYVSSDYIMVIDVKKRITYEFFYDEIRKRIRQKDPIMLLIPFIKYTLPILESTIIHASGVLVDSHRAVVFLAPSGGGKTTTARLSQEHGYKVLGDDKILISKRDGAYLANSIPFNRVTDGPGWGETGALVILKKGASFSLVPASPIDVLPKIWADNLGQWYSLSSASKRMLFSLYSDMFSNVPVYEMTFKKDYVDWAAIESVLKTD